MQMSALYLIQTYCLPSLRYSCVTLSLSPCDEKRVEVSWNNTFRKILMRIGMKVSNRCRIIAVVFLCPSCYPWRSYYFGRKCYVVEILVCVHWQSVVMPASLLWLLNTTSQAAQLRCTVVRPIRYQYIGWQWLSFFISYLCQLFSAML